MSSHGLCNGCGKGFGIFKKEEACRNCGLSFCSKCVGNKIAVPKLNGEVHHVCQRCYNIITGKIKDTSKEKRDISPPANFVRSFQSTKPAGTGRKESLKKKGVTTDPVVKLHLKPEYRNLSKEDMQIAERLERLKADHKELELGPAPLPPIQYVEQRLAKLQGRPEKDTEGSPATSHTIPPQPPTKPMSQQEETTNLLKQVTDEVSLDKKVAGDTTSIPPGDANVAPSTEQAKADDSKDLEEMQALIAQAASELEMDAMKAVTDLKKDKEIMARLEELKARKASRSEDDSSAAAKAARENKMDASSDEDSEDEEEQVKTILQQALEERRLDEQLEASGGFVPPLRKQPSTVLPPAELEVDPEELPWCCICNEDAVIRCLDCDMDLYCKRCYKPREMFDYHQRTKVVETTSQATTVSKPTTTTSPQEVPKEDVVAAAPVEQVEGDAGLEKLVPQMPQVQTIMYMEGWIENDAFYNGLFNTYLDRVSVDECGYFCTSTRVGEMRFASADVVVFQPSSLRLAPPRKHPHQYWILHSFDELNPKESANFKEHEYADLIDHYMIKARHTKTAMIFNKGLNGIPNADEDMRLIKYVNRHPPFNISQMVSVCELLSEQEYAEKLENPLSKRLQKFSSKIFLTYVNICYETLLGIRIPIGVTFAVLDESDCLNSLTEQLLLVLGSKADAIPIIPSVHPEILQELKYLAPPHSFIYQDNFNSVEELYKHLTNVLEDNNLFLKYHKWKALHRINTDTGDDEVKSAICKFCQLGYVRPPANPQALNQRCARLV